MLNAPEESCENVEKTCCLNFRNHYVNPLVLKAMIDDIKYNELVVNTAYFYYYFELTETKFHVMQIMDCTERGKF